MPLKDGDLVEVRPDGKLEGLAYIRGPFMEKRWFGKVESWYLEYVQPDKLMRERSGPMSMNELLWLIGKDK